MRVFTPNFGHRLLVVLIALPVSAAQGAAPGRAVASGSAVRALAGDDESEAQQQAGPRAHHLEPFVSSGNRFALDLFRHLNREEGNLCFSPASISVALMMTQAGAAGSTAAEMGKVLHLPISSAPIHATMAELLQTWRSADQARGPQLRMAQRLWASDTCQLLPEFIRVTGDHYGAAVAPINFSDAQAARAEINAWIREQTEGQIPELLAEGRPTGDTQLVLTNACYFRGPWQHPFDKQATREAAFHAGPSEMLTVPMMFQSERLRYAEVDQVQILELPYEGGDLSMVLLLPRRAEALRALEQRVTWDQLQSWLGAMRHPMLVELYLPRFAARSQTDLRSALNGLGMTAAFDRSRADFSGMTGNRDLFLAAVVHEAVLQVDEVGTEAAAATAVLMEPTGDVDGPGETAVVFRADRPFLFFVRDRNTQALLFAGRLTHPNPDR